MGQSGMEYEVVIGLEVHAQVLTASKLFCGCSTRFGAPPNSQTCPVCLGMPGVLPVLNKRAVEYAIRAALALGCRIAPSCRFARKHYFYPDMPKNYQISQYELPLAREGALEIAANGERRRVRIQRLHMEEDVGKLLHREDGSLVDFNRSGVPLMEIVSEPDLPSGEAAAEYLKQLRQILVYLGVCDGNMEEGSLRCDANISLRPRGATAFGTKVEIKNMNSFRNVQRALDHEQQRQTAALGRGERIVQETRLWDVGAEVTRTMRSKEEAHDYRYFPEPDLLPLEVSAEWGEEVRRTLPELPEQRRQRFVAEYGLPEYDAGVLTAEKRIADYFEKCAGKYGNYKNLASWILTESLRELKLDDKSVKSAGTDPKQPITVIDPSTHKSAQVSAPLLVHSDHLVQLLVMMDRGIINRATAKKVFEEMCATQKSPEILVQEKGLTQITDAGELAAVVEQVIAAHPDPVKDFHAGKERALTALVGAVMKATKGKANPALVNQLLREKLSAGRG